MLKPHVKLTYAYTTMTLLVIVQFCHYYLTGCKLGNLAWKTNNIFYLIIIKYEMCLVNFIALSRMLGLQGACFVHSFVFVVVRPYRV